MHPAPTADNMHLKAALPQSGVLYVFFGFNKKKKQKRGSWSFSLPECFYFENVKVAAQRHFYVGEKMTPLTWFEG